MKLVFSRQGFEKYSKIVTHLMKIETAFTHTQGKETATYDTTVISTVPCPPVLVLSPSPIRPHCSRGKPHILGEERTNG